MAHQKLRPMGVDPCLAKMSYIYLSNELIVLTQKTLWKSRNRCMIKNSIAVAFVNNERLGRRNGKET